MAAISGGRHAAPIIDGSIRDRKGVKMPTSVERLEHSSATRSCQHGPKSSCHDRESFRFRRKSSWTRRFDRVNPTKDSLMFSRRSCRRSSPVSCCRCGMQSTRRQQRLTIARARRRASTLFDRASSLVKIFRDRELSVPSGARAKTSCARIGRGKLPAPPAGRLHTSRRGAAESRSSARCRVLAFRAVILGQRFAANTLATSKQSFSMNDRAHGHRSTAHVSALRPDGSDVAAPPVGHGEPDASAGHPRLIRHHRAPAARPT